MENLLIVPPVGSAPEISISSFGHTLKLGFLASAKRIATVASEKERDLAINCASLIAGHLKKVEASRIEVKKPFYQVGQEIDRVAREHSDELEAERRRLNGMIGAFEDERQRALAKETERLREEQERLASTVLDETKALPDRLQAEEELVSAGSQLATTTSQADLKKPHGGALRKDWDITITDIKALFLAHPQCVTLKANMLSIKDLLKAGIMPAGVKATPTTSYATRGRTQP